MVQAREAGWDLRGLRDGVFAIQHMTRVEIPDRRWQVLRVTNLNVALSAIVHEIVQYVQYVQVCK